MVQTDRFAQLKAYYQRLLPSMNEENWKIAESKLRIKVYKKGEYLLKEGEVCNFVAFINTGLVRGFFIVDGREKVICFANEESYISEYGSFLTRQPSNSYIQALEPTEVVCTSYNDLQELYKAVPEANLIGRLVCESQFIMVANMNRDQANDTIEQRYNKIIFEMPWLLQRVPQYMIASYLGITPEALSRIKSRSKRPKNYVALAS